MVNLGPFVKNYCEDQVYEIDVGLEITVSTINTHSTCFQCKISCGSHKVLD